MRERSKESVPQAKHKILVSTWDDPALDTSDVFGTGTLSVREDIMHDSANTPRQENPCYHTTCEALVPTTDVDMAPSGGLEVGHKSFHYIGDNSERPQIVSGLQLGPPSPDPFERTQFLFEFAHKVYEPWGKGVSLPNFVMDLTDLTKLCKLLRSKGLLDLTTSSWLAYTYGLNPLKSDLDQLMSGIFDSYFRLKEQIYRSSTGRENMINHSRGYKIPENASPVPALTTPGGGWCLKHRHIRGEISCFMTGNASVDILLHGESITVLQQLAIAAHALGLDNPLAVLWDKIPYSFIVDWFVGISDFLDRNAAFLDFPFEVDIRRVNFSQKLTYTAYDYVYGGNTTQLVWDKSMPVLAASYKYTTYIRESGLGLLPSAHNDLPSDGRGIGWRRFLSALSLAVQTFFGPYEFREREKVTFESDLAKQKKRAQRALRKAQRAWNKFRGRR